MDKLTIFLPAARQIKPAFLAGLACLWLVACAGAGQERDGERGAGGDSSPPDAVMFHITTAERLVEVGEYASALDEYLAAAEISDDPEIARKVARLAVQLGDWSAANAAAERWLELENDADSAYHLRIIARVRLGQPEEAVSALTEWLDRDGSSADAKWWRSAAMLLAATGDHDSAGPVLDALVAEHADQAPAGEVSHARSIMLWRLDRPESALDEALQAAREGGASDHLVWAAELSVGAGEHEQALDLYRRAREQQPDDVTLALAEAEVLRQLDRDEAAVDLLGELPDSSETLYTLGVYLHRLGREAEAETVWRRLRDLPESAQAAGHAFVVARLAELLGHDEAALNWYQQVEEPGRQVEARLRRAVVLGRLGEVASARSILAELRDGGDASMALDTWLIEAEILRSNDRAADSIELLREPLANNPGNTDLLYARALSAATAGNVDLAEQDLRRIIQMDGDNAMALNALGYTLTDLTDRHQEAYRLIQRALELDSEDPATLDSMGWVLFKLGRTEEAVEYLQRALEGDPNPEIMAHLVEVLDRLGRDEEAAGLAERALAEYPEDATLRATLERLGRMP